jgi:hypothetical protein
VGGAVEEERVGILKLVSLQTKYTSLSSPSDTRRDKETTSPPRYSIDSERNCIHTEGY